MKLSLNRYLLIAVIVLCTGCFSEPQFRVSALSAEPISWDSIRVHVSFETKNLVGGFEPVLPDSAWVRAFDASFDTLFAGSRSVITLPDKRLGDRESVLVEACGSYGDRIACEQRTLEASSKRMIVDTDLSYPESRLFEKGVFRLGYRLERARFDSSGWEPIRRRGRPSTFVRVYVSRHPEDHVQIPIVRARTRFDLSRLRGYRNYRFRVKSGLMDADSVEVRFDVFTTLGTEPAKIAGEHVVLRAKSESERKDELRNLVELGASDILDRMKGFFGLRKAYVFINDWSYQPLEKSYDAEIEIHWQSGIRGRWFDMTGRYIVAFDGSVGSFEFLRGSSAATDRWYDRQDSTVIEFESLMGEDHLRPGNEFDVYTP